MNQENQSTICADKIWRLLARASVDNKYPWRVCTFCTAGASGPDSRNVILRSIDASQCELFFYTDVRSQKVKDLSHTDTVALLFWNPKTREQLRLKGRAEVVESGDLFEQHWLNVPDYAKRDYGMSCAPGTVLLHEEDFNPALAEENFRILRVIAYSMDYLRLDREGHERIGFVWKAPAGWQAQNLVP